MGAFKNEAINQVFDKAILIDLINCCKRMKEDCIRNCNPLKNHEDRISDRLVAKYLNTKPNALLRYRRESPTHFNEDTDRYDGRVDIEVITLDNFREEKIYHVVECKRIDGEPNLNKKYIKDGVSRFFVPKPIPKYPSFNGRSTMMGYVVMDTDIPTNAIKIDVLQSKLLQGLTVGNFALVQKSDSQYYVYTCAYNSTHTGQIELNHLFFHFADVINTK